MMMYPSRNECLEREILTQNYLVIRWIIPLFFVPFRILKGAEQFDPEDAAYLQISNSLHVIAAL